MGCVSLLSAFWDLLGAFAICYGSIKTEVVVLAAVIVSMQNELFTAETSSVCSSIECRDGQTSLWLPVGLPVQEPNRIRGSFPSHQ